MKAICGIDDDGNLVLKCTPETDQEMSLMRCFAESGALIHCAHMGHGSDGQMTITGVEFWLKNEGAESS
jgi:hypothetical protein